MGNNSGSHCDRCGGPPIATLLERLKAVREIRGGQWIGRCPAHDDHSPSLSVRETNDGRVLIYCFAGCDAAEIMAAVGLTLADLFNSPLNHHISSTKLQIPAADRLAVIDHEALVVCLYANQLAQRDPSADEDRERLLAAAHRIGRARDYG